MKVLEYGPAGKKMTLKQKCPKCKAKLAMDQDDLRYDSGVEGDSWGSRPADVSFKCPVCKTCTAIPRDKWPQNTDSLKRFTMDWYKDKEESSIL